MEDKPDKYLRSQTNPSFRFTVDVGGVRQGAFTECTLPTMEWEVEEVKEGGLNTSVHQLLGRRKAARVTLKNGIGKEELGHWYIKGINEFKANPQGIREHVTITMFDVKHQPILIWDIQDAYPVKWTGPQFKTDSNAIAIQTLELVCGEITLKSSAG
jgi:phage tail-like protein